MRAKLLSSAAALALALAPAVPAMAQTPGNKLPAAAGTPNGLPAGQSPGQNPGESQGMNQGMNQGLTPGAGQAATGAPPDQAASGAPPDQAAPGAPPDQAASGAPPEMAPSNSRRMATRHSYRRYSADAQPGAQGGSYGSGGEHWAHQPGTGESGPASNRASNIDSADTRSAIAPHLPQPPGGDDAGPARYLRDAETALATNRTGEAQQALEMAETRLLDRSTAPMNANVPDQSATVQQVSEARRALAAGDVATARNDIQSALASRAPEGMPAGAGGVR
jgi:hypothetical protein